MRHVRGGTSQPLCRCPWAPLDSAVERQQLRRSILRAWINHRSGLEFHDRFPAACVRVPEPARADGARHPFGIRRTVGGEDAGFCSRGRWNPACFDNGQGPTGVQKVSAKKMRCKNQD